MPCVSFHDILYLFLVCSIYNGNQPLASTVFVFTVLSKLLFYQTIFILMETVSFTQSTDEAVVENGLKFTECFKNYLDNLPPLLQRMVTRLKEIDAKTLSKLA